MSIYPSQLRSIDPFRDYNSNAVNELTRMITRGSNKKLLHGAFSLNVTWDSTSSLVLSTGQCFKDDVLIEVDSTSIIDCSDSTSYVLGGTALDEDGYYYVILDYTYAKTQPAPEASIQILRPSERSLLSTNDYLFLKVFDSTAGIIDITLYDYDPDDPTIERDYTESYVGVVTSLPSWLSTDVGRLIYVEDENDFYYGDDSQWIAFSSPKINSSRLFSAIFSGSVSDGDPVYYDSTNNQFDLAIQDGTEKEKVVGLANVTLTNVYIDGIIDNYTSYPIGTTLYLSDSTAGLITDVKPTTYDRAIRLGKVTYDNDKSEEVILIDIDDEMSGGNDSGDIPISNTTVNTDLNSDMLDGYHGGNSTGEIPISNTTVNTDLNSDMLDGQHAPNGTIVGTTDSQTLTNKTLTTPKVDEINEETLDAGVTVDNCLIKDGSAADSLLLGGVADGSVTPGNSTVSQAKLKSTTSTNSQSVGFGGTYTIVLTGGTYSWWTISAGGSKGFVISGGNTAAGQIGVGNTDLAAAIVYWDERYIQASPPYDLGDGDIPLFISIQKDKSEIIGVSVAPDPIWAYHGPTNVVPDRIDFKTGKNYVNRRILPKGPKPENPSELRAFYKEAKIQEIELTQTVKNADMNIIPHRFENITQGEVIMLDPVSDFMFELRELHDAGENIRDLILNGDIVIKNNTLNRKAPKVLRVVGASWR